MTPTDWTEVVTGITIVALNGPTRKETKKQRSCIIAALPCTLSKDMHMPDIYIPLHTCDSHCPSPVGFVPPRDRIPQQRGGGGGGGGGSSGT